MARFVCFFGKTSKSWLILICAQEFADHLFRDQLKQLFGLSPRSPHLGLNLRFCASLCSSWKLLTFNKSLPLVEQSVGPAAALRAETTAGAFWFCPDVLPLTAFSSARATELKQCITTFAQGKLCTSCSLFVPLCHFFVVGTEFWAGLLTWCNRVLRCEPAISPVLVAGSINTSDAQSSSSSSSSSSFAPGSHSPFVRRAVMADAGGAAASGPTPSLSVPDKRSALLEFDLNSLQTASPFFPAFDSLLQLLSQRFVGRFIHIHVAVSSDSLPAPSVSHEQRSR